jgi:hypothetical protein
VIQYSFARSGKSKDTCFWKIVSQNSRKFLLSFLDADNGLRALQGFSPKQ